MVSYEKPAAALPATGGSYALFLRLAFPVTIQVGRLGRFDFPAGTYVYFGSAFGPGGLGARLGRHLRGGAQIRWHVDYLRRLATVTGYCYTESTRRLECIWSQAVAIWPGVTVPVPGFGASDCRAYCPAHLFLLPEMGYFLSAEWLSTAADLAIADVSCFTMVSSSDTAC